MNQSKSQLFSLITDDIPILILSELSMKKELSVYDFNTKIYSVAQYRYALRKLLVENLLISKKKERRVYYSISPEYQYKIQSILSWYFSFSPNDLRAMLQNIDGWAFRDKSALLYYVPFLSLVTSKIFISVRSVKEQEKLEKLIPNIKLYLDIKIQPTYFRKSTNYLCKINNFPVLRPEIIYPNLLRSDDARVRLSTIFLLPHMKEGIFNQKIEQDDQIFITTVYLLSALKEFLQEEKLEMKEIFLRTWFHNYDQMDNHRNFERFLRRKLKNTHIQTTGTYFFRNMKKELKKQQNHYTKWDQAAELVPERLVTFRPETLEELTTIAT